VRNVLFSKNSYGSRDSSRRRRGFRRQMEKMRVCLRRRAAPPQSHTSQGYEMSGKVRWKVRTRNRRICTQRQMIDVSRRNVTTQRLVIRRNCTITTGDSVAIVLSSITTILTHRGNTRTNLSFGRIAYTECKEKIRPIATDVAWSVSVCLCAPVGHNHESYKIYG